VHGLRMLFVRTMGERVGDGGGGIPSYRYKRSHEPSITNPTPPPNDFRTFGS
jgi:hypothetical protein